jgi:alkanesulfonate monooxygenase SsuD/methylene tetrahydromethanopterin reductase-like flavin-dependent oxidoreductase (luciferase family)
MSGGRFELGVGTGWMEPEHERFGIELPPLRDRFSNLFETTAYLRACFNDAPQGFSGRHFELAEMEVLPARTGPLPLIIGGSGPRKTPSIAGRFADEYNMFSCDEAAQRARVTVMQQAAEDTGRDPADITLSFVGIRWWEKMKPSTGIASEPGQTPAGWRSMSTPPCSPHARFRTEPQSR